MGNLFQGSASRKPNPLELSIGSFEEDLVLVLFQLPTRYWNIDFSFRILLQSKSLELRVPSPPTLANRRVRLKSVHLWYHLSRDCPRALLNQRCGKSLAYQPCPWLQYPKYLGLPQFFCRRCHWLCVGVVWNRDSGTFKVYCST